MPILTSAHILPRWEGKQHLNPGPLIFPDLKRPLLGPLFVSIDEKRTVTLGVAFLVGEFVIKWPMLTAASLIGSLPTILPYLFL